MASAPIARMFDRVVGVDTHIELMTTPGGPCPTPVPNPFNGPIVTQCSSTVFADNRLVAVIGSIADNQPPHIPTVGPFMINPDNRATVIQGATQTFADNIPVARIGDQALTCSDIPSPPGRIIPDGLVSTTYAE